MIHKGYPKIEVLIRFACEFCGFTPNGEVPDPVNSLPVHCYGPMRVVTVRVTTEILEVLLEHSDTLLSPRVKI